MNPLPPTHNRPSTGGPSRFPHPGHTTKLHPPRRLALLGFTLLLALLPHLPLEGQSTPRKEDEPTLKAAYLLSFPTYITWPTTKPLQDGVVVGLLGEDPKLATALAEAVKQKPTTGTPHRFVRVRDIAQAAECHVLFVARSESRRLPDILGPLKQKPILTVADSDGFTDAGGGIRLFLEGTRLRMEISQANIEASGLKASTRLLRLGVPGTSGPARN